MKLILTQTVDGLGDVGDLVEVRDGYGRNYLVPQGLAIRATRGAEKQVAVLRRDRASRAARSVAEARAQADAVRSLTVRIGARSGGGGKLFGSVSSGDVADAIVAAGGPVLDKRLVTLETPLKSLGVHRVTVRLHPEIVVGLDVEIVPVAKRG